MLYYLHIPKTGGSSITQILQKAAHHHQKSFLWPVLLDDLAKPEYKNWRDADFLVGHLGLLPVQATDCQFIVTLRNPVEHLYSLYSHIRRDLGHYLHPIVSNHNLSFEQWLGIEESQALINNPQARYLTECPNEPKGTSKNSNSVLNHNAFSLFQALKSLKTAINRGSPKFNDKDLSQVYPYPHMINWDQNPKKINESDLLRQGIETLSKASLVGTTENLNHFQNRLSNMLAIDLPQFIKVNCDPDSISKNLVSSVTEEKITNELCPIDTILYRTVFNATSFNATSDL